MEQGIWPEAKIRAMATVQRAKLLGVVADAGESAKNLLQLTPKSCAGDGAVSSLFSAFSF